MRASNAIRSPDSNLIFLSEAHATLNRVVKGFAALDAHPDLVCPPKPLDLSEIFPEYQAPEAEEADDEGSDDEDLDEEDLDDEEDDEEDEPRPCGFPWGLSEETMLSASWFSAGQDYCYRIVGVSVPGGFRVYIEMGEMHGNRVLAASRQFPILADSHFVEALLRSNGEVFGTEVFGGPPDYLYIGPTDKRENWIEIFDSCFSASGIWDYLQSDSHPDDMYDELVRLVDEDRARRRALNPRKSDDPEANADGDAGDDFDEYEEDDVEGLADEHRRKLVGWFLEQHGIGR